jgi:two-component system, sensor histidine kinase LadS
MHPLLNQLSRVGLWLCGMLTAFVLVFAPPASAQQPAAQQAAPSSGSVEPVKLDASLGTIDLRERTRAWLDTSGQATLAEVVALPDAAFTPLPLDARVRSAVPAVWWVRLVLGPQTTNTPWFLSVREITTDHVDFFYQDATGSWVQQQSGTKVAVKHWPVPDFRPTFELQPSTNLTHTVYLRLADPLGSNATARIAPLASWVQSRNSEHWLLGLYFGITAVVLWLSFLNGITYREWVWATYGAYNVSMALMQASLLGLSGLVFFPNSPALNDIGAHLWATTAGILGAIFALHASSAWLLVRRWAITVTVYLVLCAAALVLFVVQRDVSNMTLLNNMMSVTIGLLPLTFAIGWWRGDRFSPQALMAFAPAVACALPQMAYNFNWIARSLLTEYALMAGVALEAILMLYLLHQRSRHAAATTHRLLDLAERDSLTGLVHARIALDRLGGMIKRALSADKPAGAMLVTLLNHEAIVRDHGRAVGDAALLLSAEHLSGLCSAVDTVARVADTRFLVCLEGPTTEATMRDLGSALLARGLRGSSFLPDEQTLDFGVILSRLDGSNPNAQDVFSQLCSKSDAVSSRDAKRMQVYPIMPRGSSAASSRL